MNTNSSLCQVRFLCGHTGVLDQTEVERFGGKYQLQAKERDAADPIVLLSAHCRICNPFTFNEVPFYGSDAWSADYYDDHYDGDYLGSWYDDLYDQADYYDSYPGGDYYDQREDDRCCYDSIHNLEDEDLWDPYDFFGEEPPESHPQWKHPEDLLPYRSSMSHHLVTVKGGYFPRRAGEQTHHQEPKSKESKLRLRHRRKDRKVKASNQDSFNSPLPYPDPYEGLFPYLYWD